MSKFYITTSIPYINSEPHIGYGMEVIQADILARYHRQRGSTVLFSAGTDEHGGKISEKAEEAGITPKQYADKMAGTFSQTLKVLNISNDRFIRTTDTAHEHRAQMIWKSLVDAGHIHKGKYSGWYCTGCETFYSEAVVKENKGVCPHHNRPYEKLEEENYFFKLSAFNEQIKKAIDDSQLLVIPESRKNEIISVLKDGLEDISVSRPKDKISWGIAVPGDDSQVMYVWFEALMNYITVLGYPEHADFNTYWPADVQIIGKDILRFHAAIWPAMLMGLGLPVQKTLFVHGFIDIDGKKISKSLGNVVSPAQMVERFGVDATRYFLSRHIPSHGDGEFNWALYESAYNSELADQLGNAVSRTAAMITKYQNGLIGDIPEPEHDTAGYDEAVLNCQFDRALSLVWEQVKGLNQYIEETKPWELVKDNDEDHMREVLAYMVGALLQIAQMLQPFMPSTSQKIHDVFASGVLKPLPGPMFPKEPAKKV